MSTGKQSSQEGSPAQVQPECPGEEAGTGTDAQRAAAQPADSRKRKPENREEESSRKGKREVDEKERGVSDPPETSVSVHEGGEEEPPFPSTSLLEGDDELAQETKNPSLAPVLEAAESGDLESLKSALGRVECSLDTLGPEGDTALHLACLYGHKECAQVLLEAGGRVDVRDEDGSTPLHDACASGFVEIVQMLIDATSADGLKVLLDSQDSDGDTPLHNAARGGHLPVVNLLIKHGADARVLNSSGETPRMVNEDSPEVESVLERAENEERTEQGKIVAP